MEPLGDGAHPQPIIQENIHKASLTAARPKVSEGVGFGIIHSLKMKLCGGPTLKQIPTASA